jgi:NAD(P)-dependent dehydrogenase (short-subunit alcohol dehydrogenase family)
VRAPEVVRDRSRANVISPATVLTGMTGSLSTREGVRERLVASVPLGRIADPADIGPSHRLPARDAAAFITWQPPVVDGGLTRF